MTPETIPIRLKATCTEVNGDVDSPKIMTLPLGRRAGHFGLGTEHSSLAIGVSTVCRRWFASLPHSALHRSFRHPRRPPCAPRRVRDTGTARRVQSPDTK